DSERHAQRAPPHDVRYETEARAVPRIKESARALELLQLEHVLIRPREIDRLRHAVRPLHAQHIGLEVAAESKWSGRTCDDSSLIQLAGPYLEPRADSKRVVLAAPRAEGGQLYPHREVRVAAVVAEQVDAVPPAQDDVLITVAVYVCDQDGADRVVPDGRGQQRAAVNKIASAVVAIQRRAARPGDDQIEPAVVVTDAHDESAPGAADGAEPGHRTQVLKAAAKPGFDVVQLVRSAVRADREDVEPAVVVVVGERREYGAGGQGQRHSRADVGKEAALHGVQ